MLGQCCFCEFSALCYLLGGRILTVAFVLNACRERVLLAFHQPEHFFYVGGAFSKCLRVFIRMWIGVIPQTIFQIQVRDLRVVFADEFQYVVAISCEVTGIEHDSHVRVQVRGVQKAIGVYHATTASIERRNLAVRR